MTAIGPIYYATLEYGGLILKIEIEHGMEKWYMLYGKKWMPYGKESQEELQARKYKKFTSEHLARQYIKDLT